jgi:hypothetical protein
MNLGVLLTVLAYVVPVVLGVWGIVLAFKYSRRVQITFIEESCLSLFADVAQGIEALEVRYRGTPVSRDLVLLRGYFMNTGKRDITPIMMEKPLRLTLPDEYKWIDCRITATSKDLKASVAGVESDSVEFKLGLFKTNEYFKFDALAAVPAEDAAGDVRPKGSPKPGLRDVLRFDHRVADAGSIQTLALHPQVDTPGTGFRAILLGLARSATIPVMVTIAGVAMLVGAQVKRVERVLAYRVADPAGDSIVVTAGAQGYVIVLRGTHGYQRFLTTSEFDTLQKTPVIRLIPDESVKMPLTVLGLAYLLVGLLALALRLPQGTQARRYRRILRMSASGTRSPPANKDARPEQP